jgi:hypothetical protein
MKKLLIATCCICLLSLTGVSCALLLTVRDTVASVPGEIQATRAALTFQIQALQVNALAEIDRQAIGIRKDATKQLGIILQTADRQLTGIRTDLRAELQQTAATLVAPIEGLRADLKPVLDNTAALTKDAQDSWDDSYWDVKALLGSATVATTQAAQTMQTVREATPAFLATAQETNRQFAGIVTDVHTVTTAYTAPLSLKQRIWNTVKSLALIGSRF